MYTRTPADHISTMLSNGASVGEIEADIEGEPIPEEDRAVLWLRAWSERSRRRFSASRPSLRRARTGGTTQPLAREFWRPEEPKVWVRKQPRWGRGWTINWAEMWRRLRGRRKR